MKKAFVLLALLATSAWSRSATTPIFINDGLILDPPQIDATAFLNRATMSIETLYPFDFQNTLNYTNQGVLVGSPGYRFDYTDERGNRRPAENFINDRGAEISTPSSQNDYGSLSVRATNVVIRGELSTDYQGLVSIVGDNVDMSRSLIDVEALLGGRGTFSSTNWFLPEIGVEDVYWGMGEVGVDLGRLLTVIRDFVQVGNPPHIVTNANGASGPVTWNISRPNSYVWTNKVNDSNYVVQAIFVRNSDTNVSHDVYWFEENQTSPMKNAVVRLSSTEVNPVTGQPETRQFYIVDRMATTSNYIVLSNIFTEVTWRPAPYEISRTPPNESGRIRARSNEVVRSDLFTKFYGGILTNGMDYTNRVVTNAYAGYQAFCADGTAGGTLYRPGPDTPPWSGIFNLDPTNQPGRVSIAAKALNLERARIRGQGAVVIEAEELLSTQDAIIDSPLLSYRLGKPGGDLRVNDLAQKELARLYGPMRMFSTVWTNFVETTITNAPATNAAAAGRPRLADEGGGETPAEPEIITYHYDVVFHVLMLDAALSSRTGVEVNGFIVDSRTTTLSDPLHVTETLQIASESLTIEDTLSLGIAYSTSEALLHNWGSANFPNLVILTNRGILLVPDVIVMGGDRTNAPSYELISISGTNAAQSHRYVTDNLEVSGLIFSGLYQEGSQGLSLFPSKGVIDILAKNASLGGGRLEGSGEIRVAGEDVKIRSFQVVTDGRIVLDVSTSLRDSGPDSGNRFESKDGFSLVRKPQDGDLLGSSFEAILGPNQDTVITWAAEDRGASAVGYTNNAALGRLFLNGQSGSLFILRPADQAAAIYVDYLELSQAVADNLEESILIDPSLTLYFANSSVEPDTLDGALGGRIRLVKNYAGPRSSVDVRLPDGRVVSMSLYLRESLSEDSDGDGIANGNDLSPLDGAQITNFVITNKPPLTAVISWGAVPNVNYRVESSPSLEVPVWTLLKTVKNTGPDLIIMSVEDPISSSTGGRLYRIVNDPLEALSAQ